MLGRLDKHLEHGRYAIEVLPTQSRFAQIYVPRQLFNTPAGRLHGGIFWIGLIIGSRSVDPGTTTSLDSRLP